MGACTTLSARSTPEMTTSLACTIATTAQPKQKAISTVTITHRAHASASHACWHRRVNVGPAIPTTSITTTTISTTAVATAAQSGSHGDVCEA